MQEEFKTRNNIKIYNKNFLYCYTASSTAKQQNNSEPQPRERLRISRGKKRIEILA